VQPEQHVADASAVLAAVLAVQGDRGLTPDARSLVMEVMLLGRWGDEHTLHRERLAMALACRGGEKPIRTAIARART